MQCNQWQLSIYKSMQCREKMLRIHTFVDLQLSRQDLWTYFCVPLQRQGAIKSSPSLSRQIRHWGTSWITRWVSSLASIFSLSPSTLTGLISHEARHSVDLSTVFSCELIGCESDTSVWSQWGTNCIVSSAWVPWEAKCIINNTQIMPRHHQESISPVIW